MPIEPVKIPQNVYIEDRIIGPITLRQIIMMMIGAGLSYMSWTLLQKAGQKDIVSQIVAWTPLGFMAAFAFVKINGISLVRFCFLMYEKMQKPQIRYWQPRTGIVLNTEKLVQNTHGQEKSRQHIATTGMENIDQLSSMLDSGPLPGILAPGEKRSSPTRLETVQAAADEEDRLEEPAMLIRDLSPPATHHA